MLFRSDGNQNFAKHIIDVNFNGARCVYAYDIDGDGDVDIAGAAFGTSDVIVGGEIAWWENDGNQNFTKHLIDGYFPGAHDLWAVDINGDGDIDILACGFLADQIVWYENDGSENFTKRIIDSYFDGVQHTYPVDVNGDGDIDVLGAAG